MLPFESMSRPPYDVFLNPVASRPAPVHPAKYTNAAFFFASKADPQPFPELSMTTPATRYIALLVRFAVQPAETVHSVMLPGGGFEIGPLSSSFATAIVPDAAFRLATSTGSPYESCSFAISAPHSFGPPNT